ncbi:MAG: ABC transporter permease [Anaerolineae bacterium]|jgi:peptide/nickel transport system permease protein|nr:ABC transporter permease [Anaerolineae bacterium]
MTNNELQPVSQPEEQMEKPQHEVFDDPVSDVGDLSQWQLMRIRFSKNKLAMAGLIGMIIIYIVVFLGEWIAPNWYQGQDPNYIFGPPSPITFINPEGKFGLRPYTFGTTTELNQETFKFEFVVDKTQKIPIKFFVEGDKVDVLFWETNKHLFGTEGQRFYVWGADGLGRDVFARVLVGGQISTTVGLIGVALSIIFGSILGTASGYWGGFIDDMMQRAIEVLGAFPQIPLWAALAAALPPISQDFTVVHRYFLITVVLSIVSWTGLARQLRAKVLSYRSADFTQAALAAGATDWYIIFTHMIPNAASHIIVTGALSIPGMILGETSLSFLGLGILPPAVSWGALLVDAQQISVIVLHPWLLIPAAAVLITVLLYSLLGDGLRDAIDPYSI